MELIVDNEPASVTAKAVNIYSRAKVKLIELNSHSVSHLKLSLPFLSSDNPQHYPFSIYSSISQISGASSILIGESPLERAQTSSWIELANSIQAQDFIEYLEKKLLSRTFLVSNHITVADIAAYSVVNKALGGLTYSEKNKYPCILRWSSHIMSLPGMQDAIPFFEIPHKVNKVMEAYENLFRAEEEKAKVEVQKPEPAKKEVEEEKNKKKQAKPAEKQEKKKNEPKKKEQSEEQKAKTDEKKKKKELTEEQKKEIEERKKKSGENKQKKKQEAGKGKTAAEPAPKSDAGNPSN